MDQIACKNCSHVQDRHNAHCVRCSKRLFTQDRPDHVQVELMGRIHHAAIWVTDGGRFRAKAFSYTGEAWTYEEALEALKEATEENRRESQTIACRKVRETK